MSLKSGWCLSDWHDDCPVRWWSWDEMTDCSCDCHKAAE